MMFKLNIPFWIRCEQGFIQYNISGNIGNGQYFVTCEKVFGPYLDTDKANVKGFTEQVVVYMESSICYDYK